MGNLNERTKIQSYKLRRNIYACCGGGAPEPNTPTYKSVTKRFPEFGASQHPRQNGPARASSVAAAQRAPYYRYVNLGWLKRVCTVGDYIFKKTLIKDYQYVSKNMYIKNLRVFFYKS